MCAAMLRGHEGRAGWVAGSTVGVRRTPVTTLCTMMTMSAVSPLGRPISMGLPEELRGRITTLAAATRRSQGDAVREVLERDLARLEWALCVGQEAADLRAGRVANIPLGHIEAELDLSGEPIPADALDDVE